MRNPVIWIAVALTAAAAAAPARRPAGAAGRRAPHARRGAGPRPRGQPSPGGGARAGKRGARRRRRARGGATADRVGVGRLHAHQSRPRVRRAGSDRRPLVVYPDVPDNYRSRIDLQWAVYTGGRTDVLERAARAEASAVTAEIETARADLRLEVSRTFWAVVTARAAVAVVEQALERSGVNVGDARERLNAGLVAAQRSGVGRSAAGAAADAAGGGAQPARRGRGRTGAARRPRSRRRPSNRPPTCSPMARRRPRSTC